MIRFFLKLFLHKTLTIPLAWSLLYPTITGGLVLRNLRLVEYDGQVEKTHLQASKAEVSLKWSSLFSDTLEVKSAVLTELSGDLSIERPVEALRCARSGACLTKAAYKRSGQPKADKPASREDAAGEKKKALRLHILSFEAAGGKINVQQGTEVVTIQLLSVTGSELILPLEGQTVELEVKGYFLSPSTDIAAQERYPVRAKLAWNDASEVLTVHAKVKDLPLKVLSSLFPDLFPAQRLKTSFPLPLQQGKASYEGRINGELNLQYDAKKPIGKQWSII